MFALLKIIDWRLIFGCAVGIIFLYIALSIENKNLQFENLALGTENVVILNSVDDRSVHCHDLQDLDNCMLSYETSRLDQPIVLLLGNSQIHAINQYKFGEETAVPKLHRQFQSQDKYFLALSQANASLQEHYLLFAFIINHLPIETLALPIVFDDMREEGVRSSLKKIFKDKSTSDLLALSAVGQSLSANHQKQDSTDNEMSAILGTVQENSEKKLNKILSNLWPVWAERPTLRGNVMLWLYQFRNWSLGINPSTTRKIIPGRYEKNRDALNALLNLAKIKQVNVLIYIAPLRNDVKIPYDDNEYSSFKSEIKEIAINNNANFINLENLVPGEFWGTKDSTNLSKKQELDFMHFQAKGHSLLAEKLFIELSTLRSNQ